MHGLHLGSPHDTPNPPCMTALGILRDRELAAGKQLPKRGSRWCHLHHLAHRQLQDQGIAPSLAQVAAPSSAPGPQLHTRRTPHSRSHQYHKQFSSCDPNTRSLSPIPNTSSPSRPRSCTRSPGAPDADAALDALLKTALTHCRQAGLHDVYLKLNCAEVALLDACRRAGLGNVQAVPINAWFRAFRLSVDTRRLKLD